MKKKRKIAILAKLNNFHLYYTHLSLNIKKSILLLLFVVSICQAYAQDINNSIWNFYPLGQRQSINNATARTQKVNADTLVLPFWDDFSYANNNTTQLDLFRPDSSLWAAGSETVRINTGMDIDAPTVGIATFDGVDANGYPYSQSETEIGLADSLISLPINLASIPAADRQSVYFSFYWQQFGLGEFPDLEDSIRLQFKNAQNQWITQWSKSGGDTVFTDTFNQEMIQVVNQSYYHNAFQFRFQSFNRLSGAFDTWNIDYVYMNSGRSASNTAYLDRALTSLPSSPFGEYTAIPMKQFAADPARYIANSEVDFYNLYVQLQPVRFTALVRDQVSGNIIQVMNNDIAISPIPTGLERRTITSNAIDINAIDLNLDSLYIETEFHITSGDNFLIEEIIAGDTIFNTQVDYRVNDTVRTTFVLDEYFAYDDGEAEFGVEVNQNGGKVAYQFVAPKQDLLTHIDIYFPPLNNNQGSIPFQLNVWSDLEDSVGQEVLLRSQQATSAVSQLNGFITYELTSPVVVKDTFYVGYEQIGETYIAVGFDKNTDASSKTFYNVTGAWDQDTTLNGSLMIRPGFDKNRDVTSIDEPELEDESIRVFPNPSDGKFSISKDFDELWIYDTRGRLIKQIDTSGKNNREIKLELIRGVYVLKIVAGSTQTTRKLLIK